MQERVPITRALSNSKITDTQNPRPYSISVSQVSAHVVFSFDHSYLYRLDIAAKNTIWTRIQGDPPYNLVPPPPLPPMSFCMYVYPFLSDSCW